MNSRARCVLIIGGSFAASFGSAVIAEGKASSKADWLDDGYWHRNRYATELGARAAIRQMNSQKVDPGSGIQGWIVNLADEDESGFSFPDLMLEGF